MHTKEAPRQHTTVQKLAEFTLNKVRQRAVAFGLPGEKCFQMSDNNRIEGALFSAPGIIGGIDSHAARQSNPSGNSQYCAFSNFRGWRTSEIRYKRDNRSRLSRI